MRSYVTFRSRAFNTSDEREIFLKPGHFGDDVAAWFADALSDRGWEVEDEITQEPLGWFVTFSRDGDEFDLGVTCLNPERGTWLAWLEQPAGFFSGLFGKRHRAVAESGPQAIDEILTSTPTIEQVRWHTREQFVRGDIEEDENGTEPEPISAGKANPGYLS